MAEELYTLLYNKTSVAYGPGTGDEAEPQILEQLLSMYLPLVIDADGLRLLAKNPQMLPRRQGETVLTPHLGEMQALMKSFGLDGTAPKEAQAVELAKRMGCVVVLKGRFTIVAEPNGRMTLNMSGGPALSTAGSGDVLTGLIGPPGRVPSRAGRRFVERRAARHVRRRSGGADQRRLEGDFSHQLADGTPVRSTF